MTTNACDTCQQAHKKCSSLSTPSNHAARGVPAEDALARNPLWSTMMKPYASVNGHREAKQADGNNSRRLTLSLQVLICPPLLLGHHPMVTSLRSRSEVIIRPMMDGNSERTFELGPTVTNGIQMPKTKPTEPPQQDSPVPTLPRKQTLWQPTLGPSGTRWLEELFCKPSRAKEPPNPGPSPSSEPPVDVRTCEPKPEVAPTQSTEERFARPTTPHSIIIIDNTPVGSPPPLQPRFTPSAPKNPNASSPGCKAPLIPMMKLTRNILNYNRL
ncbi:hypothetical protein O181_064769 [Austropuccinia psidii MF-1]|uniref:Uncharacterized protein n=1 Tax=Austropuccinia psidii MF-1 TaxID=1389203 RepID=A0A9Q3I3W3_9BASI|nr:hypothetical protein [Austropuccinia psidii MF-1]